MTGLSARRTAGGAILLGVSTLVVGLPMGAGAQDVSIGIPLDTVVRGAAGSEHVLASEEVPPDLVGSECRVAASAINQESIHPGNDLVISSNGDQLVLEDVEGEAFGERAVEGSLTLGVELTVTLVMGPDGVFSAGMEVEVRCPTPETTTTTEPTMTTTTIDAATTTTTAPETTTTVMVSETTTTTTETTVPETTTTMVPETTTTTMPAATTTTDSTLPFTGVGSVTAAGVALVGLVTGVGLIALSGRTAAEGTGLMPDGYTDELIAGVRVRLVRSGHTDQMIEGVRVRLMPPGD
jgi:hypothetical protein